MCWGCGFKICSNCSIKIHSEEFIDYEFPSIEKIKKLEYYQGLKILYMILEDLKDILHKCLINRKSLIWMINKFFVLYSNGKATEFLYQKYTIFVNLIKAFNNNIINCSLLEKNFLKAHDTLNKLTTNVVEDTGEMHCIFPFYTGGGHKKIFETIIDYVGEN